MYKLDEIKYLHFEVTSKCQASCPMCARNIWGGEDNPWLPINEVSLEQFRSWFPTSFIRQLENLSMCGNYGDPIIAKDTLEILKYVRSINRDVSITVNTNGSARNDSWWIELVEVLGDKGDVHFGIDGLADTHSLYRKGTSFEQVIKNASTFIENGGSAVWDMLVFEHNQHQVEECDKMAYDLGFDLFVVKHTSRFQESSMTVLDKQGRELYKLKPSSDSKRINLRMIEDSPSCEINCKVKSQKNLYVDAQGNVFPCCWIGSIVYQAPISPSRIDYKTRNIEHLNLNNTTLDEIFDSGYFEQIENTWKDRPLTECSRQCGKLDKFREQFI